MSSFVDFSKFVMHRLKKDKITKADLEGPVFKLLKGTCRSSRPPVDLSKPLLLQEKDGRLVIPVEFFSNNDLEYLKIGNKERKYTVSMTKTKAIRYELVGIEEMILGLWSLVIATYDKNAELGIYHLGLKRQLFYRSRINATFHHEFKSRLKILKVLLSKKRVEDVQLRVESYQKKLNITRPQTIVLGLTYKEPYTPFFDKRGVIFLGMLNITRPQTTVLGLLYKEPYTPFFDLRGVIFLTKNNMKKLMRANELLKFCDGTLKSVHEVLHYRLTNFKMGYNADMPMRAWTNKDQNRIATILKEIDDLLLERRIC
ncbi:hypothetical protein Tco_0489363 [Tanacetum coccineum]